MISPQSVRGSTLDCIYRHTAAHIKLNNLMMGLIGNITAMFVNTYVWTSHNDIMEMPHHVPQSNLFQNFQT